MRELKVSNLKQNSLKCDLCGSLETRHVAEYEDGRIVEAWWRCLSCKKEYGSKLHFFKRTDGTFGIETEILWKKDFKDG